MKKIISILLVVLAVFSLTATAAFAESDPSKPVTVYFYDDNNVVVKVINVGYGENYNDKAPTLDSYIIEAGDGTKYKVVHDGWSITNLKTYENEIISLGNLPIIYDLDKVTEVHVVAEFKVYENNIQNNVQDAIEKLPGSEIITNASDFFNSIISLIKTWFMNVMLFLAAFK